MFTAIQKVKWPYNTRVLFVDFSKAFDVIDHNVLLNKFISNNIPEHIIVWSLDFLNGRKQFVKIGYSVSNTTVVGAGTPQGNDFKLDEVDDDGDIFGR